jgi:hypothetical protein
LWNHWKIPATLFFWQSLWCLLKFLSRQYRNWFSHWWNNSNNNNNISQDYTWSYTAMWLLPRFYLGVIIVLSQI